MYDLASPNIQTPRPLHRLRPGFRRVLFWRVFGGSAERPQRPAPKSLYYRDRLRKERECHRLSDPSTVLCAGVASIPIRVSSGTWVSTRRRSAVGIVGGRCEKASIIDARP